MLTKRLLVLSLALFLFCNVDSRIIVKIQHLKVKPQVGQPPGESSSRTRQSVKITKNLINATTRIASGFVNTMVIEQSIATKTKDRNVRMNAVALPTSLIRACQPASTSTLIETFRFHGDFNQNYVAVTQEEAALFPNLLWKPAKKKAYCRIIERMKKRVMRWAKRSLRRIFRFKQILEKRLHLPLSKKLPLRVLGRSRRYRKPRQISGALTESRTCYSSGAEDAITGTILMCAACSATTKLPSDRFPRYINEIVCNGGICLRNEGVCAQKMFSMTLLRKTGNCVPITDGRNTVYIEEWAPYQQNIRTCCECQLKKNSFLTMFVK